MQFLDMQSFPLSTSPDITWLHGNCTIPEGISHQIVLVSKKYKYFYSNLVKIIWSTKYGTVYDMQDSCPFFRAYQKPCLTNYVIAFMWILPSLASLSLLRTFSWVGSGWGLSEEKTFPKSGPVHACTTYYLRAPSYNLFSSPSSSLEKSQYGASNISRQWVLNYILMNNWQKMYCKTHVTSWARVSAGGIDKMPSACF